jgi:chromate transporter
VPRRSREHFLDGVNVASLALMAVVTWQLGRTALTDWFTIALTLSAATLLIRWRINSAWLVLGWRCNRLAQRHPCNFCR